MALRLLPRFCARKDRREVERLQARATIDPGRIVEIEAADAE